MIPRRRDQELEKTLMEKRALKLFIDCTSSSRGTRFKDTRVEEETRLDPDQTLTCVRLAPATYRVMTTSSGPWTLDHTSHQL